MELGIVAVLSLSLGALFALRMTVTVLVALSGAILVLALLQAGWIGAWSPLLYAVQIVVPLQVGYALCAMFQSGTGR